MSESVKIVPATCTQCGGTVEVDPNTEKAECPFCGTTFIVEKAINNYYVQHANIGHADNVNIDMTGSVKSVLDFVGDQMKESRAERREERRAAAEDSRQMNRGFLKIFGIMCAAMMVFAFVAFIVLQFTGGGEGDDTEWDPEYLYSEDEVISCYIDWNDMLVVNITDPGRYEWDYETEGSTEILEDEEADFDGYHFTIRPKGEAGTGYAVVSETEPEDESGDDDRIQVEKGPESYGIVKFTFEDGRVTGIDEIAHVGDISEYDFNN